MRTFAPVARSLHLSVGTILLALLLVIAMPRCVRAQAQAQSSAGGATQSKGNFVTPQTANDQNLAAAQEEDETAVYKSSASVHAFGKLFHLSPKEASSAFEFFNFLLLAGLVLFFALRSLPKMFRDRQQAIDRELSQAKTATEEASERLQAVEARLAKLDGEIDQLRRRSEEDAKGDEQRIKDAIEEERRKVVASAEQEIEQASMFAARQLREFAAELTMDRLAGRLQMSEDQDRALVRDFASGLHERRN